MLICETFINELDGKTLKKIYSDSNFYVREIATGVEYEEAIIPYSRSQDEFEETDHKIEIKEQEQDNERSDAS